MSVWSIRTTGLNSSGGRSGARSNAACSASSARPSCSSTGAIISFLDRWRKTRALARQTALGERYAKHVRIEQHEQEESRRADVAGGQKAPLLDLPTGNRALVGVGEPRSRPARVDAC